MALKNKIGRVRGSFWYSGNETDSVKIQADLVGIGHKPLSNDMYLCKITWDIYQCNLSSDGETLIWEKESNLKGEAGAFMVSATYDSVAQMNVGYSTDSVKTGGLVIINTDNVEDEDNAKMFIKREKAYHYLTDLSGKAGIKGNTGNTGATGSQGVKGDKGNGITSVAKISTVGLTDMYKITFTDGTFFSYTVANGADGIRGIDGLNGTTFTPTISASGDISWANAGGINNPPTVNVKGEKGDKGDVGNGVYGVDVENGDLILYTQDVRGAEFKVTEDGFLSVILN